jgi:hypothetical protein
MAQWTPRNAPQPKEAHTMDALILIVIAISALLAFDWLALQFGVDSRDGLGDDHAGRARSAGF